MIQHVWLIPAFPLAAFLVNGLFGRRWLGHLTGLIGSAAIGASAIVAIGVFFEGLGGHGRTVVPLTIAGIRYHWIAVGDFSVDVSALVDPLSAGMLLGIIVLFLVFGSLNFGDVFRRLDESAPEQGVLTLICVALFFGATGKSAQLPLHSWLPDAMEGPTPVSALIHAATMVTAGVYLVARSTPLFTAAGSALTLVAVVGALTAIFAATIALVQVDIKRVMAYSTVSQLGYMFLALGVGAPIAAIFHLATHAFFKALLFLGSGSVIHAMDNVQDMRRYGGLRRKLPWTYWTMLIAGGALSAIPPLAGFWSKDEIVGAAFTNGYPLLWGVGVLTGALTAFYVTRALWLTFHGEPRDHHLYEHAHESPPVMVLPLAALAVGSAVVGFIGVPPEAGFIHGFLKPALEAPGGGGAGGTKAPSLGAALRPPATSGAPGLVGLAA